MLGKHLNLLPEIEYVFDSEKKYQVCHQLYRQKLIHIIQNEINEIDTNIDERTDLNEPLPIMSLL